MSGVEATTAHELLCVAGERYSDAAAVVFPGETVSYADLLAGAATAAAALHARGVRRGDRVAVLTSNRPELIHLMFAASWLGAIFVPVSPRYRLTELDHVLPHADPAYVFVSSEGGRLDLPSLLRAFVSSAGEGRVVALPEDGHQPAVGLPYLDFLDKGTEVPAPAAGDASDVFSIIYTSGTTAYPKGVQIPQYAQVTHPYVIGRDAFGLTGPEAIYSPLPLYYQGGQQPLMFTLAFGGTAVILHHFDVAEAAALLERESCTLGWPGFPLLLDPLLDAGLGDGPLRGLRACMMHATPPEVRRLQERLPDCAFLPVWGCTEGGGAVAMGRHDDSVEHRVTTNGRLLEGFDVRVVDDAGQSLPRGEEGEFVISGPAVSPGYHGTEPANAAFRDGAFWTGDLGRLMEDGTVRFRGRRSGLIKVGGVNVSPAEVEEFLMRHDAIRLAQVIGVPDDRYGEVPAAFIELAPGGELDAGDVLDYCRGSISRDRVPRYVRFVDEWPMSTTKVQKHVLRDSLLAEMGRTT